jgi:hypothetical protein
MKRFFKKTKGLVKGTPVAVLVSIGIHGLLLFAALTFVVFTVVKKDEVAFVPIEKLDRPQMKLKKLQVQVKQDSKPKQSTERIATTATKMTSNISLPEMTAGVGDGFAGEIGGFDMLEDLGGMTLMGAEKSIGNDLLGTFYYLMQYRNGSTSNINRSGDPNTGYNNVIREFLAKGWDTSVFGPYWRAPRKLYGTQVFVPPVNSRMAPEIFGDYRPFEAAYWLVHYKGKIAYTNDARFRFWGYADNSMYVRINGEVVLDASYPRNIEDNLADWRSTADDEQRFLIGGDRWRIGDWFEMKAGEPVDMEVLFGEQPGGGFKAMLVVQEEGVEYPDREKVGGPLLPIFKTSPTPQSVIDEMSYHIGPGWVDFTNGPIFSVY